MILKDKSVLITGGTGSLGKKLVSRIMKGDLGIPEKIIVFSRDEAKQHQMRLDWKRKKTATDEIIYHTPNDALEFQIGDIRDYHTVLKAASRADIIINTAALKQVPTCEYFPFEAVRTNIEGAQNIVTAVREGRLKVEMVVDISTDKACKPVNVMGMTKAIQERIIIRGNLDCPDTKFVCVRYGNVLASRGSVIPLFLDQIAQGGPVTITTPEMTRFLLSLDQAVDTIFDAIRHGERGETYIPRIPAARVTDVADAMIAERGIEKEIIGVRPGEKVHEVLVSEEERHRTFERGNYYVIEPIVPELRTSDRRKGALEGEYTSESDLMTVPEITDLLEQNSLLPGMDGIHGEELLQ